MCLVRSFTAFYRYSETKEKPPTLYSPYHEVEMFLDGQTADENVFLVHEPRQAVHVNSKMSTVHSDVPDHHRTS